MRTAVEIRAQLLAQIARASRIGREARSPRRPGSEDRSIFARKMADGTNRTALIVVCLMLVAALVAIGVYAWVSLGDGEMSANGYVALVLGVLGTVALAGGLMGLLVYSQRSGYDDAAGGGDGGAPGRE
jgi:hypothetical protein